jgi:hypothetical protein
VQVRDIRFEALDLSKAWEYISTQDPERGLRFVLPIPNWQEAGITHDKIVDVQNKGMRFTFKNYTDKNFLDDSDAPDNQGVKIDGSSAIIFSSLTLDKANKLSTLVRECSANHTDFSPSVVANILERAYAEFGLGDRYNKGLAAIGEHFQPYDSSNNLGLFLPNENRHAAIYLDGVGRYMDGPTLQPQEFSNGAFVTFPGITLTMLFNQSFEELKAKSRLVQAQVFLHDRDHADGSRINLARLPI